MEERQLSPTILVDRSARSKTADSCAPLLSELVKHRALALAVRFRIVPPPLERRSRIMVERRVEVLASRSIQDKSWPRHD